MNTNLDEEVISYVDVLESYYDLGIGNAGNPSMSFDDFYDSYYAEGSNRNLYEFTLKLAYENGNYEDVSKFLSASSLSNISTYQSSSSGGDDTGGGDSTKDASYILKSRVDYSYTPESAFAREPYRSVYDYSSVSAGDIVWETETILFNSGHNALITDMNHNSYYGSYIQTVEAVGGGVQFGFLDDLRMTAYKCKILRVKGSDTTKVKSAIKFAKAQIGKDYSLNTLRLNTSIDSKEWYCSELVYASWKYAGIDIGVKKDSNGKDVYLKLGCLPIDISNSYNTYQVSMPYYGFLSLSIDKKSGSTWKIKVENTSSENVSISYNTKMCTKGDAEKWTNLKNVEDVDVSAYSSTIVDIFENWLSTSITTSYVKGNYRIITYADNLDNKNGTLTSYHSVVKR